MKPIGTLLLLLAALAFTAQGMAAEAKYNKWKARKLVSKSTCFKCHSVTRKKVGPPYLEVAAKYKDDPEARDIIFEHITTKPIVKIKGKNKTHPAIRTKDQAQLDNVISWLLSTNRRK